MANNENVLEIASEWIAQGRQVALATVVGTWGSSPRPVGSQLAVDEEGSFVGSVSGGCIEGSVITESMDVITNNKVKTLDFGVSNEQAWEVGLACGGNVKVFLEKLASSSELERLCTIRPLATVTDIQTGKKAFYLDNKLSGNLKLTNDTLELVKSALRDDKNTLHQINGTSLFVHVHNLPLRLLIVGAVHITQMLVPMAQSIGYEVTVIDPRDAFASSERFPNITLVNDWPDDAITKLQPDSRTAIVTLTHDPKLDDPALCAALNSECFYIGSLGSKKTHNTRLERLAELGFMIESTDRINAPIGLDLGAISPSEIAVSIVAQIIATKHEKLHAL